jgi:hypothetical protein
MFAKEDCGHWNRFRAYPRRQGSASCPNQFGGLVAFSASSALARCRCPMQCGIPPSPCTRREGRFGTVLFLKQAEYGADEESFEILAGIAPSPSACGYRGAPLRPRVRRLKRGHRSTNFGGDTRSNKELIEKELHRFCIMQSRGSDRRASGVRGNPSTFLFIAAGARGVVSAG